MQNLSQGAGFPCEVSQRPASDVAESGLLELAARDEPLGKDKRSLVRAEYRRRQRPTPASN